MPRTITLSDFLTKDQMHRALMIWKANKQPAGKIAKDVIQPNLEAINAKLGQSNNVMYLAYACEQVFNQLLEEEGK